MYGLELMADGRGRHRRYESAMQAIGQQIKTRARFAPHRFAMAGAWCAELFPRYPYETTYTPAGPIIGFAFEGQAGTHAFGSDRRSGFRARPNGLAYVPVGCDVYSASPDGGEYLKITFVPEASGQSPWERRFSDVIDPIAIAAAHGLRRLLLEGDSMDVLQCERFVLVLSERARSALSGTAVRPTGAARMTPYRLRLIDELIEAKLDSKLTVQELAGALGLSAGFFSRAFRAAIGKAPHDHIIDCRVSRRACFCIARRSTLLRSRRHRAFRPTPT
jgi:AraC family transcriptional regulator